MLSAICITKYAKGISSCWSEITDSSSVVQRNEELKKWYPYLGKVFLKKKTTLIFLLISLKSTWLFLAKMMAYDNCSIKKGGNKYKVFIHMWNFASNSKAVHRNLKQRFKNNAEIYLKSK